ncbi:MAG TPA: hypothetical protein ENJ82_14760 [Bacteroidetes bacterium]|nr:hypothetical protein [Bacteroidota bacterium]
MAWFPRRYSTRSNGTLGKPRVFQLCKLWFGRLCRLALANWDGVRALRVGVPAMRGGFGLRGKLWFGRLCRLALANWGGERALRAGVPARREGFGLRGKLAFGRFI